ncbi:MAG TPA: hypothetical protein VGF91_20215 [Solirubrobacteraceae bacterium]|jgi:hypothetical protein
MFDLQTARNPFDFDRDPLLRAMQNTKAHDVTSALSRTLVNADDLSIGKADRLRRISHLLRPIQADEQS